MGERELRHLDLPGVLGEAPRARGAPQLRPFCHHGQVEGRGAGEDESGRERQVPGVPGVPGGLRPRLVPAGEVQQQGRRPVSGQGGHCGRRRRMVPGVLARPELDPASAQDAANLCPRGHWPATELHRQLRQGFRGLAER